MRSKLKRGYAAVAVMAIALTLLIVSMTAPVASSTADFSIFNSGWNGTSDLAVLTYEFGKFVPSFKIQSSGTDITVEQIELEGLDLDPLASALIIIGPTKKFTAAEGELVEGFVRGGGQLLIADDFGSANSLLEGMGATSRFSEDLVMDLAFEKQPEFSVVYDLSEDDITRNVTTLLLNYPSSLIIDTSTTESIARSSVASWLDVNGDRLQEWGEPRGPFTVAARETMGLGSVFLVSDPSLLINGMRDKLDNGIFGDNLISEVSLGRTTVFFDESHRDFFDPITVTMEYAGHVSDNAKAALAIVALVLTLWISTDLVDLALGRVVQRAQKLTGQVMSVLPIERLRRKKQPKSERITTEQLLEKVYAEHPEWRTGLVRYLVRERERHAKHLEQK